MEPGYVVGFSAAALEDIDRLTDHWFDIDLDTGWRARHAMYDALQRLADNPFIYRKAHSDNALLRELVIGFGSTGYIALYEIGNARTVTVLAIRHQREDDYH